MMQPMKLRLILLIFVLAACGSSDAQQTLEANYVAAGTQVADLRLSATVQGARARTTVDAVQTDASLAATRSQFLESTLVALDAPENAIATFRAQSLGAQATAPPTDAPAPNSTPSLIAGSDPDSTPTPTIPPITPLVPTQGAPPLPTSSDPDALRLEDPAMATGVDNNGCAVGVTTQFSSDTQEIYIVARGVNIPANRVTFEARWFREGQPIGPVYSYSPQEAYDSLCIWFFVDQTDFAFEPGSYSAVMTIDGSNAFQPLPFTITAP